MRKLAVIVALTCVSAISCDQERPKGFSDALYVARAARDVKFSRFMGQEELRYSLSCAYPASTLIRDVREHLAHIGFDEQTHDLLNPEIPTSAIRGWQRFEDARKTPSNIVHVWNGEWRDGKGDYVLLALAYSWEKGKPENVKDLGILMIFMPAERVRALLEDLQKVKREGVN